MDPQVIVILLAVLGAIFVAFLGWAESGEKFKLRKFSSSIGRAILGGLLAVLVFQETNVFTIWTYVSAFLIGAGIDVTGHRLSGTISQIREQVK